MSLSGFLDYQRGLLVCGVEARASEVNGCSGEPLDKRDEASVAENLFIIREGTSDLPLDITLGAIEIVAWNQSTPSA